MTEPKYPFDLYAVECGEGWKGLYQPLLDLCKLYGIDVLQVKEKFGGLRFYVMGSNDYDLDDIIRAVEAASYHTCEDCGENGVSGWGDGKPIYKVTTGPTKPGGYWISSLCEGCRGKRAAQP